MQTIITRFMSRFSSVKDTSKLCFSAATCFAAIGAVVTVANYSVPGKGLSGLLWIAAYYLALGLLDQWRPARTDTSGSIDLVAANDQQQDNAIQKPVRIAA